MNIRFKAIASVTSIITILTLVFVLMSIQNQNTQLKNLIQTKKENATFLAENIQENAYAAYKSRIVSLATTKTDVIKAFAERDREALYQASLPFFKAIKNENPYFSIMHFHLPDNSSFLRMHRPDIHGDYLADPRNIIYEVNSTHKQRTGYEVSKSGLFYRVVQPMFDGDRYIGALEFGISHNQLIHLLQKRISPEITIAVKSEKWRKATLVPGKVVETKEYTLLPDKSGIVGRFDANNFQGQESDRRYTIDGKNYVLFSGIKLLDFQKEPIAKILVAMDISEELAASRSLIIKVVLIALLLLIISILVLHFSFGQLLKRIMNLNTSLSNNNLELTTAKAYVDNILASMSDGLIVTTANGTIKKTNKALCQLLGYQETELLGNSIYSFFTNPQEVAATFVPCRINGCSINKAELQLLTKEGVQVPIFFSATSLAVEADSLVEVVCIFIDITERKIMETALHEAHDHLEQRIIERTYELAEANTALTKEMMERKRAESELRQAQKMRAIGTLAGGIAHDFNNILTAIIGYTQLTMLRETSDATSTAYLGEVFTASQRAQKLVQQILTFSRQSEQEKRPIGIHLIVKEALMLLRASMPANIEIVQSIPENCGAVIADPTQIHQVIMNLCTNAYHAIGENSGTMRVSIAETTAANIAPELPSGDYLQIMVSDTGCGMDTATLDRIFEPYFTTKETGKGTGLGLAVTHGIVEGHGGHIRVASTTGVGTTFSIYLPLHKELQTEILEQLETKEVRGGSERILVVDDEKELSQLLALLLSHYGYKVTSHSDSIDAYEWFLANRQEVDLLITDLAMPRLTGQDLAIKIAADRPDLPIIICSGYCEEINRNILEKISVTNFFQKPFKEKELILMVRDVLDTAQRYS